MPHSIANTPTLSLPGAIYPALTSAKILYVSPTINTK